MKVDNIFSLVGSDENAVTKSFAFILGNSKYLLRVFLKLLGLRYLSEYDLENARIEIQVTSDGRREITDLEIKSLRKFYVIVESKIGDRHPDEKQLIKYAQKLNLGGIQEKRLVLLTENDENEWYSHCFDSNEKFCGLNAKEYIYLRWNQVNDVLFQQLLRSRVSSFNKMFLEYMEGIFMPEEILIVAVNSQQEFEILEKHHFYRFPVKGAFPKKKAMYIAIYYKGIEYLARIVEYKVMKPKDMHPLPDIFPEDYGSGTKSGEEDFYKVIVGSLIKLPFKITNPRHHRIAYMYTTFDKLLTAKYIHEL